METAVPYLAIGASAAALLLAAYFAKVVNAYDRGTDLMIEIGDAIAEGAMAFLKREYQWVTGFVVIMTVLIAAVLDYGRPWGAIAYLMGAVLSSIAGFVGMRIATAANTRTANAAQKGAAEALPLAFKGGAVMGFTVAGLALFGISFAYLLFVKWLKVDDAFQVVAAFGLGGSSIALFARIGGGIFTKAADVGGDLVGKVEAGIPEDDPRNPATIADAVGDNVGDVAGMGADLFESYAGSLVAPIVLVSLILSDGVFEAGSEKVLALGDNAEKLMMFPILIGALGMIASIIGALLTRGREGQSLSAQLHFGSNIAMGITAIFAIGAALTLFGDIEGIDQPIWLAGTIIAGTLAGYLIGFTSEYFTSDHYRPVKQIAEQSETGPATVVIAGTAQGMISTAPAVILVVAAIGGSFWMAEQAVSDALLVAIPDFGLYGVALAAIGMLATTGVIVAVDAYGPIADNAGGIAEMAGLPPEVRDVTDSLDSLGNTTAAVAKGFAVGSAAVTALALFKAFSLTAGEELSAIDINEVPVTVGLFLGAMVPFVFASLTMSAVGRAAQEMIEEVRRQFREIPGLREGTPGVKPDSARCVDISTQAALREMLIPGGLAIVLPLIIGFISVKALGGFLAGALVTGFLMAIYMANSGGAWDNAKKYIEAGAHGGKGSDQHKAAVVGDTIGDPFKDTSGPSMNILIKVMTIVSLVFVPAFL